MRVDQAHPVTDPGFGKGAHEANASVAHGTCLDPGLVILGSDEQGLKLRSHLHALSNAPGDQVGRKELVLNVKGSLRGIDRIEEEPLHLARFLDRLYCRLGAGDADAHALEVRLQVGWPTIAL